jgi:hypothetical protein
MNHERSVLGAIATALAVSATAVTSAFAADFGIAGDKLLILDEVAKNGKAEVDFIARDANVAKGPSTDPAEIEGTLQIYYEDAPLNDALFRLPSAWLKNEATVAKYVNGAAPAGGGVKVAIVRPGKLVRVVTRSLGDLREIEIVSAPPGPNGITVVLTIDDPSDGSTTRLCTNFSAGDITVKNVAGGTGRRLLARNGRPVACRGGTTILMQPDLSGGFFSMPWPNDVRVKPDGTIDLDGYPGRASNAIYDFVLTKGSAVTKAFGTNAAAFLRSTGALDPVSLPSADDTTAPTSPILLVNLDDTGAPPAPLLIDFRDAPTTYRPGNLLTLLPYPGHPLDGETRYAIVVLEGLLDGDSFPLWPAPLLAELDEAWDPGKPVGAAAWAALQAQRDEVLDYVDQHTSWASDQVVAFSVFTTQDVSGEMDAVAAAVEALPQPTPVSRSTGTCSGLAATVTGELDLPKWQEGAFPYLTAGGAIVVEDGVAVRQSTEHVNFELTYPCGPAPAEGWPILLYMNGTGACPDSAFITELGHDRVLNPLPYVVASISPLYSCERDPGLGDSEFVFFNFINPLAGRTNQLQQAADMMYLRRVVEGIVLSAAETGAGAPVETDDDIVVVAGHSQGALTIPQLLAADPAFDGGFISAGGAGLYHSIIHRGDVRPDVDSLLSAAPGELDMFHPVVHVLQTLAEVGDAANYARRVDTAHVVLIGGTKDGCSPLEVIVHLGTALGLDVANPLFHPFFGSSLLEPPTIALPVGGNLPDGRTGVTIQLDTGHFGARTNPLIGRTFVESLAGGGTPTVDPGTLSADFTPGCAGRFDPL